MKGANFSDAPPLTPAEEKEITQLYEERADHLELESFGSNTALTTDSDEWVGALTGPGAKLLVGPRGCGKTHLMRFAFTKCISSADMPFAVYTNLNRYYRLEPLLRRRPDAIAMFYGWVLANIFVSLYEAVSAYAKENPSLRVIVPDLLEFSDESVRDIIGRYEQGRSLDVEQEQIAAALTIDRMKTLLLRCAERFGRRRVVLFLDDAALTLTPEFLSHFFDIFRAMKAARIAPKASVYPGTTEYGPNFHASHEADTVIVWKRITDEDYLAFMLDIGRKRFPDMEEIQEETRALLAYAAFGVPRAFMALVRSYLKNGASARTSQSAFNTTLAEFLSERFREYHTLEAKKPQFASIVRVGKDLFEAMAKAVVEANELLADGSSRQLLIGIDSAGVSGKPYIERMFRLLEEVGMIFQMTSVSHGDREYMRFVPHMAALQAGRAFSRRGSFSPKFALDMIRRPDEKHPVRRSMSTLLEVSKIEGLGLDLPDCRNCQSKRVEGAKYCHVCGERLTEESRYDQLMLTPLAKVPGLTAWQRARLEQWQSVPKTVGEFIALQDPGTTLRTIRHVGEKRAKTIIDAVQAFLDEYLS